MYTVSETFILLLYIISLSEKIFFLILKLNNLFIILQNMQYLKLHFLKLKLF